LYVRLLRVDVPLTNHTVLWKLTTARGLVSRRARVRTRVPTDSRYHRRYSTFAPEQAPVGVDHRGPEARMPQCLLDEPDVLGLAVQIRGKRMPEHVRMHVLGDPRLLPIPLDHRPQVIIPQRLARSGVVSTSGVCCALRAPVARRG